MERCHNSSSEALWSSASLVVLVDGLALGGRRSSVRGWVDDLLLKLGWSFPGARLTLAA